MPYSLNFLSKQIYIDKSICKKRRISEKNEISNKSSNRNKKRLTLKILVVNDEVFQLEMCTLILKNIYNIKAETAMNGKIALDVV